MPQQTLTGLAKEKLVRLLEGFNPIPDTLAIGSRVVVLQDLVASIFNFRQQRRVLYDFGLMWPSARLSTNSGAGRSVSYWVPIDLRDLENDTAESSDELRQEIVSGQALQRARERAQGFGLSVSDQPLRESDRVFTGLLSEILVKRSDSSPAGASSSPPSANFEVTTDTDGVEVVYADGHFLSTSRGFGYSTPAEKFIPYGTYTFGYSGPTGPDYLGGVLWTVPDDSHAHLKV
jgi:hypothetical protein